MRVQFTLPDTLRKEHTMDGAASVYSRTETIVSQTTASEVTAQEMAEVFRARIYDWLAK